MYLKLLPTQFNPLVVDDKKHSLNNVFLNSYLSDDTSIEAENFSGISISFQTLETSWRRGKRKICIQATDFFPVTWDYSLSQHLRILKENVRGGKETFNAQSNSSDSLVIYILSLYLRFQKKW